MRLSEVLDRIEGIQIRGNIEIEIAEIKCDSRLVNEGDMFVAIVGYKTDGHVYVESALQKGCFSLCRYKAHYNLQTIPFFHKLLDKPFL